MVRAVLPGHLVAWFQGRPTFVPGEILDGFNARRASGSRVSRWPGVRS